MKTEIIFLYNNHRCHAEVVEKLSVEKTWKTFVGRVDGYEIYRTCGVHFNQFGFEAIKLVTVIYLGEEVEMERENAELFVRYNKDAKIK